MTTLKIFLLGGLRLSLGEQVLPALSPLKLEALLAFLMLHRQQPVPRDQLAECLWPDDAKSEARANLRRHLHLLRQALPEGEWVLTDRETMQWNPAAEFWLDVDAFTHNAAQGACEQCLELYQGDLLPELYDDWLIPERENLSRLLLQSLQSVVEHYAQHGDFTTGLHYARRLLTHDPLHEETHRTVMRLSYLAGDRQAALHQFEECKDLLRRELDVGPMPATLELYQTILAGQPLPSPSDNTAATRVDSPAASPTAMMTALPQPAKAQPAQSWRRRWPLALAGVAAVTLVLVLLLPSSLRSQQCDLVSLVISGPASAQDTWITVDFPNDLYWPDDPDRTPHYKYSRAHMQYFDQHPKDRILIQFDLNALPATAQIQDARLEIHLETWVALEGDEPITRSFPASVNAYQMLRAWQPDQATFNQAASGQPWAQPGLEPGVDFVQSPQDTQPINGTTWLAFNVRQAVSEWQRYPDKNHGLVLMITEALEGTAHYWVDMTDAGAPSLRPVLQITYH